MGALEWFTLTAWALCALALLPFIIEFLWRNFTVGGEFDFLFSRFLEERRKAGVSVRDAMDELCTREFFIQLRVDASDSVKKNPDNWKAELDAAVQRGFDRMAQQGKAHLMTHLAGMLQGHSYSNILFEDACDAVERSSILCRDYDGRGYTNLHAALKITGK